MTCSWKVVSCSYEGELRQEWSVSPPWWHHLPGETNSFTALLMDIYVMSNTWVTHTHTHTPLACYVSKLPEAFSTLFHRKGLGYWISARRELPPAFLPMCTCSITRWHHDLLKSPLKSGHLIHFQSLATALLALQTHPGGALLPLHLLGHPFSWFLLFCLALIHPRGHFLSFLHALSLDELILIKIPPMCQWRLNLYPCLISPLNFRLVCLTLFGCLLRISSSRRP